MSFVNGGPWSYAWWEEVMVAKGGNKYSMKEMNGGGKREPTGLPGHRPQCGAES